MNVILRRPFDGSLHLEIFYNRGEDKIVMIDRANAKYSATFLGDAK